MILPMTYSLFFSTSSELSTISWWTTNRLVKLLCLLPTKLRMNHRQLDAEGFIRNAERMVVMEPIENE